MSREIVYTGKVGKGSEELFIDLFCDVFGPDKTQYIFVQYPFTDIYGNHRFIDFAFESEDERIAIEVDGETYHNPNRISENKYFDDLLKQNSLVYNNWKIYRWVYSQLKNQPERVKDEMLTFFGELPMFKVIDDYLPSQRGKVIELKDHQHDAISSLQKMRNDGNSIALLYHATGVGKIFPFVRSHNILNKLHQVFDKLPVVLFYPGKYDGQTLVLFSKFKDDHYYRAFPLVDNGGIPC